MPPARPTGEATATSNRKSSRCWQAYVDELLSFLVRSLRPSAGSTFKRLCGPAPPHARCQRAHRGKQLLACACFVFRNAENNQIQIHRLRLMFLPLVRFHAACPGGAMDWTILTFCRVESTSSSANSTAQNLQWWAVGHMSTLCCQLPLQAGVFRLAVGKCFVISVCKALCSCDLAPMLLGRHQKNQMARLHRHSSCGGVRKVALACCISNTVQHHQEPCLLPNNAHMQLRGGLVDRQRPFRLSSVCGCHPS